jgi:hypothetical protein
MRNRRSLADLWGVIRAPRRSVASPIGTDDVCPSLSAEAKIVKLGQEFTPPLYEFRNAKHHVRSVVANRVAGPFGKKRCFGILVVWIVSRTITFPTRILSGNPPIDRLQQSKCGPRVRVSQPVRKFGHIQSAKGRRRVLDPPVRREPGHRVPFKTTPLRRQVSRRNQSDQANALTQCRPEGIREIVVWNPASPFKAVQKQWGSGDTTRIQVLPRSVHYRHHGRDFLRPGRVAEEGVVPKRMHAQHINRRSYHPAATSAISDMRFPRANTQG